MEARSFWEENGHPVKYDNYNNNDAFVRGDLRFPGPSDDEAEYGGAGAGAAYLKKGKVSRQDPLSHRIIEKRRRDRMNNCLADLSRLIPPEYLKKGRGRVEKTEIIEMATRHLKYLQERANGERRTRDDSFQAGYQEAGSEAVRFLVEVRGYSPSDLLCQQMAAHLQMRVEAVTKNHPVEALPREKLRVHPNTSSETTSSNSSSQGFSNKGVNKQTLALAPPPFIDEPYPMECDRGGFALQSRLSVSQIQLADTEVEPEPQPLDGRRRPDPTLRAVRKPDHEDFLQSYKFKNSIERRFSRSQDSEITEATDMLRPSHPQNKVYSHKRRRPAKPAPSASTSNSGSNEENRDNSPQDTSSESPHSHFEKAPSQLIPVFALNACGKFYVPLSVEYSCLSQHVRPFSKLEARSASLQTPLHPVTINVNFQPCLDLLMKRERDLEWRVQ